jgi:hypothetical protein
MFALHKALLELLLARFPPPLDGRVPNRHHSSHRHDGIMDPHLAHHRSRYNTTKRTPLAPNQNNPTCPPTTGTTHSFHNKKPKISRLDDKTPSLVPPQSPPVTCDSPSPPRDESQMPSELSASRPVTFRFRGAYLGAALTKYKIAKRTADAFRRTKTRGNRNKALH